MYHNMISNMEKRTISTAENGLNSPILSADLLVACVTEASWKLDQTQ